MQLIPSVDGILLTADGNDRVVLAANRRVICFGILPITQELELFSVVLLLPRMAMFNCAIHNVGKPAYKDQAYTDLLKSASSLNPNALLRRHFSWGKLAVSSKCEGPRTSFCSFIFFFIC